jgi:hypothetical protein
MKARKSLVTYVAPPNSVSIRAIACKLDFPGRDQRDKHIKPVIQIISIPQVDRKAAAFAR